MDIVVAFIELAVLMLGYLVATVINKPFWFIAFALLWAGVVVFIDRKV